MTMEGVLWKWTNYWSGWQTRWFVLESGVLSYYNSQEEVNQGCKGSMKVSAIDIKKNAFNSTGIDIVLPGKLIYLRAENEQERQKWVIALGSSKACDTNQSRKDSGDTNPDILKVKKSELRMYCDLLMQQVHTVKTEASKEGGPEIQALDEATSRLGETCDTFIKTLEECIKIVNSTLSDSSNPVDSNIPLVPHAVSKFRGSKNPSHIVRSLSTDKKLHS